MSNTKHQFTIPLIKKSTHDLFFLAYTDQMTECYNRNMLEEFRKELDTESNKQLFVTIVDIDGLKAINDSEGHAAGDSHIKWIAKLLSDRVGIIFRLGGDEFLLLDRAPIVLDNIQYISYGSVEKQENETLAQAMHRADLLMYERKRMKKNRPERGQVYVNRTENEEACSSSERGMQAVLFGDGRIADERRAIRSIFKGTTEP